MAKSKRKNWYLVEKTNTVLGDYLISSTSFWAVRRRLKHLPQPMKVKQATWRMLSRRFDLLIPADVELYEYAYGNLLIKSEDGLFTLVAQ